MQSEGSTRDAIIGFLALLIFALESVGISSGPDDPEQPPSGSYNGSVYQDSNGNDAPSDCDAWALFTSNLLSYSDGVELCENWPRSLSSFQIPPDLCVHMSVSRCW